MIKLLPARRPHPGNTLRVAVLAFAALLVFSACDSVVDAHEEDPEEDIERTYTKTIERTYANEFERALIDSAEAAYPPRDSVIAILDIVYSWRDNGSIIPQTEYWHMSGLDGVLQPYMITIDAIEYYDELIDSLNEGAMPGIKRAVFGYRSEISFHEEFTFEWPEWLVMVIEEITGRELNPSEYFEQVHVVEMSLLWVHVCVEHCMAEFDMKRVVILDKTGKVLRIFKDGPWWPTAVS